MRINQTQEIKISAVVNHFSGNLKAVRDGIRKLSSWELLEGPGPDISCLSIQDVRALEQIRENITSDSWRYPKFRALQMLVNVLENDVDLRDLENSLDWIENNQF